MFTNRTALCGGYPSPNLQHGTNAFMGLVLKFLHERTEGEVRNLFTPKFFHTAKVQVFKEQNIQTYDRVVSQVSNGDLFFGS